MIRIRPATEADLPDILGLYEATGVDAPGDNDLARARATFARMATYPDYRVLVAVDGDRVLGTLAVAVLDNLAHGCAPSALVEDVAVHPDAQGQGIGRALIHHAMDHARACGCYKLALSANAKREKAHAFYESLGLQRHGYSFSVTLDD
jgi:GNAT superfamily N-acetyltransferase